MEKPKTGTMIPGLTLEEIAKSKMPLPDRASLTVEEQAAFDYIDERNRRFFYSVPENQDRVFRLNPMYQALMQTPRLAELWARLDSYFQAGESRGSYTSRERELVDHALVQPLREQLGRTIVSAIHVADAVGAGMSPLDIRAIHEGRLDDISPDDRQLVEYVQAVARSHVNAELFDALVDRMGLRTAVEYTMYAAFTVGRLRIVYALLGIQDIVPDSSRAEELLQKFIDGLATPHPPDRGLNWVGEDGPSPRSDP